jgi:pyruvate,orthophosphate dikinase
VELTGDDLKEVVRRFKGVYAKVGKELPSDPFEQARGRQGRGEWVEVGGG